MITYFRTKYHTIDLDPVVQKADYETNLYPVDNAEGFL